MENKILVIMLMWIYCFANPSIGQTEKHYFTPKIGDTLPEYTFSDLRNYEKDKVSLSEFRGKWLIVDFWSLGCASCIQSFPKMSKLHEKFSDDIHVLMVGNTKDIHLSSRVIPREKPTKDLFERLAKDYDLKFTVSFDSLLYNFYGIQAVPFILVIDPNGILRYITSSINEQAVAMLLKGEEPKLNRSYTKLELEKLKSNIKDEGVPSVEEEEEEEERQLYKSELAVYDATRYSISDVIDFENPKMGMTQKVLNEGVLEAYKYSTHGLFTLAYFGKTTILSGNKSDYQNYSRDFVFEAGDSLKIMSNTKYAYRLKVPVQRANPSLFMKAMRKDLELYFGLKAVVEKRAMPAYYLKITDKKKAALLKTKGESNRYKRDNNTPGPYQLFLNNEPMESLSYILGQIVVQYPVFNCTAFGENIDIDLRAYLNDFNEVQKALALHGLTLEQGLKEMNTIVIYNSDHY